MADDVSGINPVELATELTIAWLGNPNTRASGEEAPEFLAKMHQAVLALGQLQAGKHSEDSGPTYEPATTVRRSLASADHIISMIDGKPYKTLRRHLSTHGMTPEQYRERYNLKPDYPMVAPSYSQARRSMAQAIGLGQKGRAARNAQATEPKPKARQKRGRKPKSALSE